MGRISTLGMPVDILLSCHFMPRATKPYLMDALLFKNISSPSLLSVIENTLCVDLIAHIVRDGGISTVTWQLAAYRTRSHG